MAIRGMRLVASFLALCIPAFAQLRPQVVDQVQYPKPVDLSGQSWTDAFASLNKIMSREYPFTQWRRIDWTAALQQVLAPHRRRPSGGVIRDAFRKTLREYIYSFPDGHVKDSASI